jgi:SAM-dependent methyltransferase
VFTRYWGKVGLNTQASKRRFKSTYLHPCFIARSSLSNILREYAKHCKGVLLDVGCGEKPYETLFFGRVHEYVGLDLSRSDINKADIFADGLHLPFASASFDAVLCTEVIEHVPEPGVLLHEVNRVLKEKGILLLSAPLVWGLHAEPHDFFRFTKYGLKHLMKKTNFQVLKIQPTCGFWATYGQRLSDFLFQKYGKSLIGIAFILPICAFIQFLSMILDKAFGQEGEPLDYVVVASKRSTTLS